LRSWSPIGLGAVTKPETCLNPYAALLEVSQTGKGQRSAEQGYHRTGTEDGQITGRESGQAANNNYPRQSGSGQAAD